MAIQRINLGAAPSGTGGDTNRSAFKKIDDNFTDSANAASRLVGTAAGNVMEVGAFGLGANTPGVLESYSSNRSEILHVNDNRSNDTQKDFFCVHLAINSGYAAQIGVVGYQKKLGFRYSLSNGVLSPVVEALTRLNTSIDGNGFIKAASPIIKLFADKIELNDEAQLQQITFEKLGVGDYLIKGSTGFAQKGWYIEMPKDANGNVLVAVVYEQLDNNDISVKTYDYMLNKKGRIVPDLETPLDIPSTRWIDLRLQALPQDDTQPLDTDETVATNAE